MKKQICSRNNRMSYQISVFIVLMIILFLGYMIAKIQLDKRFVAIEDDFSWVCQIDSIKEKENEIVLEGFAFCLNCSSADTNFDLILHDIESGKGYFTTIDYVKRDDVDEYFKCEYDYSNSGFIATLSKKKISYEGKIFEILLRPKGTRESYQLGTYFVDGSMCFVDPRMYTKLNIEGTELKEIVDNGVLRVYRPEVGMYVYQYKGSLYWIAEKWYEFIGEKAYVQYQLDTTQISKLPEERLRNNWLWSNLEFSFYECELKELETENYRVARYEIPQEYSVTKIWTGNHDGKWLWKDYFRPWYDFE